MPSSERGMTLVEVMISAMVLSLISLGLSTAMRTFSASYLSAEMAGNHSANLREASSFLRHSLREALYSSSEPLKMNSSELVWLAPLDRIGKAGGVVWMRLSKRGDSLILEFAPRELDAAGQLEAVEPSWGQFIRPQSLLENLVDFRVSYRKHPGEEWRDATESDLEALPHSVRLNLELLELDWPPLIVTLDGYRESLL